LILENQNPLYIEIAFLSRVIANLFFRSSDDSVPILKYYVPGLGSEKSRTYQRKACQGGTMPTENSIIQDYQQIPTRVAMAKQYFEEKHNLGGQDQWYSNKASRNKAWHQWLGFIVIAAGAGTSLVQIWAPSSPETHVHWVTILTAALGAIVVLAKGIERIWNFDDTWAAYRQASEAMKREQRLFINGAGPYVETPEDEAAYVLFVNHVERIIAEEQKSFWVTREEDRKSKSPEQDKI
jgi:ABC-type multidrug transport system fused ATPase/permease subunit